MSFLLGRPDVPGTRPAVLTQDREISYGELRARVRGAIAALVDAGLDGREPDVRLAFPPRLDLEDVVVVLACIERGIPILALHPRLGPRERELRLASVPGAHRLPDDLVLPADGPEVPPERIDPARALAVLFTSGTSGRPKAAELSRRAFAASAAASALRMPLGPSTRSLLSIPLAHVGGLSVVLRTLGAGGTLVLADDGPFDPRATHALLESASVTHVSLVPTMLARLIEAGRAPATLGAVLLGGAAAPASLVSAARARGYRVRATYGLTEACSQVATWASDAPEPGVGRPLPGTEVRERGGVLEVRGPTMLTRYVGGEPALADSGWFSTGDAGFVDADGFVHVRGRRADLVVTGGENVYPAEVEEALLALPGVAAAVVFGVPDALWGERVAAAIVLSASGNELDAVVARARADLASYARPRLWAVLEELPLLPGGKVDRRATAELARARFVQR